MSGKQIKLFLVDGTPGGLTTAEITQLDRARARGSSLRPGRPAQARRGPAHRRLPAAR
ncbi:MAG: hypothetical protein WKF76_09555 [Nocardioidaceae bacterium]